MTASLNTKLRLRAARLLQGGRSQECVAEVLEVSIDWVRLISIAIKDNYAAGKQRHRISPRDISAHAKRCPECGRLVLMPCYACRCDELNRNQRMYT